LPSGTLALGKKLQALTPMKTNNCRLSVGLVGFLRDKRTTGCGDVCQSSPSPVDSVGRATGPDLKPDYKDRAPEHRTAPRDRPIHNIIPDSRRPLIAPEVRAKIEAIEAEARAKGWPAELLWNNTFWDLPRGLAAVLDEVDEIAEVTSECIVVVKRRHDLLKFRRHGA
jgi:hypothetical protein